MENKKVLLGMSGGVDSSVSALLLKQQGYEVIGTTLELFAGSSCCNINTYIDAKNVCSSIGIPHFTYDYKEEFKKLYNNSAFSNLEYTDDDIKENGVTVFSYDKNSGVYKFMPDATDNYGTIYTRAVYTYDVDNYIKGNKYIVSF